MYFAMNPRATNIIIQAAHTAFIFVCFSGIALMAYGIIKDLTGYPWQPAEAAAPWLSTMATFLALGVTASSIYFPEGFARKPIDFSKWVTAPIIILGSIVGVVYSAMNSGAISPHLLNGAALLAMGGALLRLLPKEK